VGVAVGKDDDEVGGAVDERAAVAGACCLTSLAIFSRAEMNLLETITDAFLEANIDFF